MKKKIVSLCLCVALLAVAVIGGTMAYFTDVTDNVQNTFTMGKVDIKLDEADVEIGDDGNYVAQNDRVITNDYTKSNIVPGKVFPKDPTIHVEEKSEESYLYLDLSINKFASLFWVMAADASADKDINFTIFDNDGKLLPAFANDSGVFSTTKFVTYMAGNKAVFQKMIDKWITGINHADWELIETPFNADSKGTPDANGTYLTFRFGYIGAKGTDVAGKDIKFMDSFQMPASVTQEMIAAGKTVGHMQNNFNTDSEVFHMNFKAYAVQADGFDTNGFDTKTVKSADMLKAYKDAFPGLKPAAN
ncbi:MAG: SipW-dependent-type signal peptide-containing protein [Clostridiales bacterium]|nr:SipW-dependent-type signal peptide-containing protein [Candidatus Cacconaster stercorequi]